MDDALGDALVIEVEDLLAKDEVLEQHRAARAGLQLVLVVGDADALVGGEMALALVGACRGDVLMQFVARAAFAFVAGKFHHDPLPCRRALRTA